MDEDNYQTNPPEEPAPKIDIIKKDLTNLSKEELELLKLKTEILKVRQEVKDKNRPWIVRNILALLPSFLAAGAIVTGVITGFFQVESKRLENQKHDLQQEVKEFTDKKDSLHTLVKAQEQENKQLKEIKEDLSIQFTILKDDTANLNSKVKNQSKNLAVLTSKNLNMFNQYKSVKQQRDEQINKRKSDIRKTGIGEYLDRVSRTPIVGAPYYNDLFQLVKNDKELESVYLAAINDVIETTNNNQLKITLMHIMFDITQDRNWKNRMMDVANSYLRTTTDEPNIAFWNNLLFTNYQDSILIISVASSTITQTKNERLIAMTFGWLINNLGVSANGRYNLIKLIPRDNFIAMVEKAAFRIGVKNYLNIFYTEFMKNNAPLMIIPSCKTYLAMSKRQLIAAGYGSEFIKFSTLCIGIIKKNQDIFTPFKGEEPENWVEWFNQNQEVLFKIKNFKSYKDNSAEIRKYLVGN